MHSFGTCSGVTLELKPFLTMLVMQRDDALAMPLRCRLSRLLAVSHQTEQRVVAVAGQCGVRVGIGGALQRIL